MATTNKVFLVDVTVKDKEIKNELDNLGCSRGNLLPFNTFHVRTEIATTHLLLLAICADISLCSYSIGLAIGIEGLRDAHFVMARSDAVYFYSPDGRGQCYAIEGTISYSSDVFFCFFVKFLVQKHV